jgi:carbamoyltransferase
VILAVGIAANEHDSSIAIANETRVLAVIEAERWTREKHRWSKAEELERLVEFSLASVGLGPTDVTHWCGTLMGNTLFPPDERFCASVKRTRVTLFGRSVDFLAVNHHLAHAAGAFFASPFDRAVVDACDAGGDGRTRALFTASRGPGASHFEEIELDPHRRFSGVFYDVCSYYLFKRYMQEGRFMGLASFGGCTDDDVAWLKEHAEAISALPHERSYALLDKRFSLERFDWRDERCRSFAAAVQEVFVHERERQLNESAPTGDALVLCGGTALNIHANARVRLSRAPDEVFVPPCCEDSGQALGSLLYLVRVVLGAETAVELPFLGLGKSHASSDLPDSVAERVVEDMLAGKVVAWHWGRAEIGPRALGHRSLLTSPLSEEQRVLVSEHVKGREPYRPVAPVILIDQQAEWFGHNDSSPYMLFSSRATSRCVTHAPAAVHVDGTARLQTIDKGHVLAKVLALFFEATGVPMVINTSLNGPNEPIAQTYRDTLGFCTQRPDVVPYLDGRRVDV